MSIKSLSVCLYLFSFWWWVYYICTTRDEIVLKKERERNLWWKYHKCFSLGFPLLLFFFLNHRRRSLYEKCLRDKIFRLYMRVCEALITRLSFLDDVTLRARQFANWVVLDSCCRGGSAHIWVARCFLHIWVVRYRTLFVRPERRSNALWRFRASTSNSPSGRSWPHPRTPIR